MGLSITEADPTNVGPISKSAHVAGLEVNLWRAKIFKLHPTDVGAIGVAAQISRAIVIDAEITGSKVLVANPVGGRATAQLDPTDIGAVDVTRADEFANDSAVG